LITLSNVLTFEVVNLKAIFPTHGRIASKTLNGSLAVVRLNRDSESSFLGRNLHWQSVSGREAVCPPSTSKAFGAMKCIVRKGVILQEYEAVCLADVDGAAPLSVPNLDDAEKKAGRSVRLEELERSSVRTWKAVSRGRVGRSTGCCENALDA
jgi:hypothetical protein